MDVRDRLIVFDGLVVSNWGLDVFKALRAGGITACNATCAARRAQGASAQ
jgi:membrane dipeptidase